jgi:Protein of unknown function (DUF1566)
MRKVEWFFLGSCMCLANAQAQTETWSFRTDVECRWTLDGVARGVLKASDPIPLTLALGEHRLEAVATTGGEHWEGTIKITRGSGHVFMFQLIGAKERADTAARGYWLDPDTGLIWASADTGANVNRNEAAAYCSTLASGPYRGWALPHIGELESLRDPARHSPKGGIVASSTAYWSDTPGRLPGEALYLGILTGSRYSVPLVSSAGFRALCVRRSGE